MVIHELPAMRTEFSTGMEEADVVRVREAIVEELVRQGVTKVFGLVGEDVVRLGVDLVDRGVDFIATRHEATAVAMADGYSRVTGDLGVVVLSRGPGVTNALSSMVTASRSGTQVLVLAGASDPVLQDRSNYTKYVDQATIFDGAGVRHVTVASGESALNALKGAVAAARTRCLVAVNLEGEVLEDQAVPATSDDARVADGFGPEVVEPRSDEIRLLADALTQDWSARRPLILAGRGAVHADARDALVVLAEQCGGLLGTTLMAKGLFQGEPFDVGIVGTYASEVAVDLLYDCDIVLGFGTSLHDFTTLRGAILPQAQIVLFDPDSEVAKNASMPVEMVVQADARLAAESLSREVAQRGGGRGTFRTPEIAARLGADREPSVLTDRSEPGAVDPRLLMRRLDEVLPVDRTVVIDNGHHMAFSTPTLSVPGPGSFISPVEYVCLSAAPGMALGAAVGDPSRPTVLVVGDAGLLMGLGDLETAARYDLPVIVIVMNDAALGAELHYLQALGVADELARCETPHFADVARALGIEGITVTSLDDLDGLSGCVENRGGPLLVDCHITQRVRADWLEFVMFGGDGDDSAAAS